MRDRLPLVLSASALLVAVLGATPVGHAAHRAIRAVPPFAKTAGYATFSGDSAKLNGRRSTLGGAPGTIPVVGKDGKLPPSIGAVGPQGIKGDKGPQGPPGLAGVHIVETNRTFTTPGFTLLWSTQCPAGEVVTGGGGLVQQYNANAVFIGLVPLTSIQPIDRSVTVQGAPISTPGTAVVTAWAICAKAAG